MTSTAWRGARRLASRLQVRHLVVWGISGFVLALALIPLSTLLARTFFVDGEFTFDGFRAAYSTFNLGTLVANSLTFTLGATAVAVLAGTALAYLTARTDIGMRPVMIVTGLLPLLVPGILHVIAWIFLAAPRQGLLNSLTDEPLLNVFSMTGLIVVDGLHSAPIVYLLMLAAFTSFNPALEDAASMCGASWLTTTRRVTLPMLTPALAGATLIVAIRTVESFETPALLGVPAGIWVFTTRIYDALNQYPAQFPAAGAYALVLLALTIGGAIFYQRVVRDQNRYATITGKQYKPTVIALRRWRIPLRIIVGLYFVLTVVLPFLVLVYVSTQPFFRSFSLESLAAGNLSAYSTIFESRIATRAIFNSLQLGAGAATIVMGAMLVVAWQVQKSGSRFSGILDALVFLPLAIPGLVLGVSMLTFFTRSTLPIYGTGLILLIAYMVRFMPYGLRYSTAAISQLSGELEESAYMSGAAWLTTLRKIYLPLMLPGLLGGWIYVFTVSIRELSSSILLYSPGNEVISVLIFGLFDRGEFASVAALGVLMISGMAVVAVVGYRLVRGDV